MRLPGSVGLSPSAMDMPALQRIYYSTHQDELRVLAWAVPEMDAFLPRQLETQHLYSHVADVLTLELGLHRFASSPSVLASRALQHRLSVYSRSIR